MSARPIVSPDARIHGSPTTAAPSTSETSPWLRALLIVGATLTAVSFAATVLLLVSYFLSVTAWPLFYWFGLYGLPLGFVLMLTYVVAKAVLRRRA
ncbi:hypothetical protein [Citricoccus sp. K5]|uniref:hypothetical protein n=1 Tax=Citricoccus sp. K5 TaxID=2653135 RepID=UPI0012F28B83|nr:hypothetical protein [Citricoccus sp. K5]VXA99224.1 conserved hypothetical protein [Citricoccus sp. K5]